VRQYPVGTQRSTAPRGDDSAAVDCFENGFYALVSSAKLFQPHEPAGKVRKGFHQSTRSAALVTSG
jgi:hypothetical protein